MSQHQAPAPPDPPEHSSFFEQMMERDPPDMDSWRKGAEEFLRWTVQQEERRRADDNILATAVIRGMQQLLQEPPLPPYDGVRYWKKVRWG